MELMQLKYFCEVAQSQHMTRSAEKLHFAQPALSMSIRRLEEELGVKLFAARGRGIVLTDAGRLLHTRLIPVMEVLERLPEEVRRFAEAERATIRLSIMAASACITDAVIAYRKTRDVQFRLVQNLPTGQNRSELCDIEITTRHRHHPAAESEYIFTEPVMLAVPDAPRFAGMTSVSLDAVRGEDFVCLAGTREFRAICDRFCAGEGFLPKVVFESDTPSTVQNLIESGCGVGFWPRYTWGKFPDDTAVRLLEIENGCTRDIVCSRRGDSDEACAFFDFLRTYMESLRR
ncbi:MAG: LysR family transcriptional regulator [Clostridia bacterium]|nr:LysR family transcriptional regulator [Clostridia bacterium]